MEIWPTQKLGLHLSAFPFATLPGDFDASSSQRNECLEVSSSSSSAAISNAAKNGNTLLPEKGSSREVYVKQLEPDSAAFKSDRLRVGDQILEINGIEVINEAQASQLLAQVCSECAVFVARPNLSHDHYVCRERAAIKKQQLFNWSIPSRSTSNHVSLIDARSDFTLFCPLREETSSAVDGEENDDDGAHATLHAESLDADYLTKVEKDSGLGKTDGESTGTQANYTSSTDCDLSLEKVSRTKTSPVKSAHSVTGTYTDSHSDASLDREMTVLHQEMANIQLECDKLISRHLEQRNNQLNANGGEERSDCQVEKNNVLTQQQLTSGQSNNVVDRKVSTKFDHHLHLITSPPATPKHYPKWRQPVNGDSKTVKVDLKGNSSKCEHKTNDQLLPEFHPTEKKEAIKRWIKSGMPSSPTSGRKLHPKLGICKPQRNESRDDGKEHKDHKVNGIRSANKSHANGSSKRVNNQMKRESSSSSSLARKEVTSSDDLVYTEDKGTQMSDIASYVSNDSCTKQPEAIMCSGDAQNNNGYENIQRMFDARAVRYTGSVHEYAQIGDNRSAVKSRRDQQYPSILPSATMYTNKANLEHTILLQQELLRQALLEQDRLKNEISLSNSTSHQLSSFPDIVSSGQLRAKTINSHDVPPSPSKSVPINGAQRISKATTHEYTNAANPRASYPSNASNPVVQTNTEWKVKKRPDGSRYITKKPLRQKILKERAHRINQERSGLTTDDDAMSELKAGRYWPRDERKKQVEQARDRKRKETSARAARFSCLREQSEERDVPIPSKANQHVASSNYHQNRSSTNYHHHSKSNGRRDHGAHHGGHLQSSQTQSNQPSNVPSSKNRVSDLLTVTTV